MRAHSLPSRFAAVKVADVMHAGVFTCDRETPLSEVAATMTRERIHCVVVENGSGEGGDPWGIVSDLDLVAAATVRGLEGQLAGGSAATPIVSVAPTDTLERAAQLMTEHASSRLLVVEPRGHRPVGVLSTTDITAVLSGGKEER